MPTEPQPQGAAAAGATTAGNDGTPAAEPATAGTELPELPLFSCREAYVYRVPPATTSGHRAEMWDVNNWLATVSLRVVQADDDAFVRLLDNKSGELFAECPVPVDKPLVTAVEPVVDSSRYFVLRIVDRDSASQRHAFIGIGFRDRSEASDFNAALHEYLQYIKRKRTAEAMRHAYEERERLQSGGDSGSEPSSPAVPLEDLSIKQGETLKLRINAPKAAGSGAGFVSGAATSARRRGMLGKSFSLLMDGHGGAVAALSPPPQPPPGSSPKSEMSVSPNPRLSGAGDVQQRLAAMRLADQQQQGAAEGAAEAVAAADEEEQGDEFGDFAEAPPSPAAVGAAADAAAAGKQAVGDDT